MEPFVKFKGEVVDTRFSVKRGDLISKLDLRRQNDRSIAKQALELAYSMAERGLQMGISFNKNKEPRADIFNSIVLKDGRHKLYVQDIDSLALSNNTIENNWRISSGVILLTICHSKLHNAPFVRELISEVEQSAHSFNYR